MKRMLEFKNDKLYINSSSIEIINTCRRKAMYSLALNLRKEDESEALTFGSAIHAALERFYASPSRSLDEVLDAFNKAAAPLAHVPPTEKRSIDNGAKIIRRYFEVYEKDPWVAYVDKDGPVVERSFEVPFNDMILHGTVDAVLQNTETGELVVCDHKTATSLSDLAKRANPNLQFSIYVWALQQMGIPVTRMMVNGIQVAKTKSDFIRIFTERGKDDFDEMHQTILSAVDYYDYSLMTKQWPMNPASCAHYGGCQYLDICSLTKNLRAGAIEQIYGKDVKFLAE